MATTCPTVAACWRLWQSTRHEASFTSDPRLAARVIRQFAASASAPSERVRTSSVPRAEFDNGAIKVKLSEWSRTNDMSGFVF